MIEEIWKDIKGYEGLYQVSNLGSVKSLNTGIKLKPNNNNGHLFVALYKNGKRANKFVHRLVAENFIDNPKGLKYVKHKDNNSFNNIFTNLEYTSNMGQANPRSRRINQLDMNNNIINTFHGVYEAVRETGLCYASIYKCLLDLQEHTKGYKWEYAKEK